MVTKNLCVRCGKERVFSRTWKEVVKTYYGETTVEYTETVCPDKECQKLVEEKNNANRERYLALKNAPRRR